MPDKMIVSSLNVDLIAIRTDSPHWYKD